MLGYQFTLRSGASITPYSARFCHAAVERQRGGGASSWGGWTVKRRYQQRTKLLTTR
jgi:hypothetical protein